MNGNDRPWIVWCDLNAEGDELRKAIPGAVEIRGSDDADVKEQRLIEFAAGKLRVLITKPSIAGWGLNWQHCRDVAFVGVTDSYEAYYQAVRRCWRFGQTQPVNVHVIASESEGSVVANIRRKEAIADAMAKELSAETNAAVNRSDGHAACHQPIQQHARNACPCVASDGGSMNVINQESGNNWTVFHGDCVEVIRGIPDRSVDYSIFSPPFSSLYTYSNSPRDMGNRRTDAEFFEHFDFLVSELARVVKPGHNVSFHCMMLPTSKERDGYIGLKDFRGDLIRSFQKHGFIYASEVTIWKDPVTAMQRTKALGLLHKTVRTNATMSRQGIADYLVTMRAPAKCKTKVAHGDEIPVSEWQRLASPVWDDIN